MSAALVPTELIRCLTLVGIEPTTFELEVQHSIH